MMGYSQIDSRVPIDDVEILWPGQIDHAEGLAIGPDGTLWCGGEDGQIYRIDPGEAPLVVARVSGRPLGFALDAEGAAFVATEGQAALYRVGCDGSVDVLLDEIAGRPLVAANHPAFLSDGSILCTDSGHWGADDGFTFRLEPDGRAEVVDMAAARFPNGLCVTPDGGTAYVVESRLPGVCALDITPSGMLTNRRVIVELPGAIPDGVALDESGRLLVACWNPDSVLLIDRDGSVEMLVHDHRRFILNSPTNVAFVPGTATVITANYGERQLARFEHDTTGASLFRPRFEWVPERGEQPISTTAPRSMGRSRHLNGRVDDDT